MGFRKGIVLLFILTFGVQLQAQKGWEVGGWVGLSHYFGDLNTRIRVSDPGLAFGIIGRRNFNTRTSWKTSFNFAQVGADDANSNNNFERNRNLSFKSNIFDFSSQLEFNFLPYIHGSTDAYFTPYILAGFSFIHYNPKAELNGDSYSLRDFGTEGQDRGDEYGRFTGGLLFGGGFKWDINYDWSINVEIAGRKLYTDYLDDVSGIYPNQTQLLSDRGQIAVDLSDRSLVPGIADEGRQRGNDRDNDLFVTLGIGIVKYFGRLECPKISNKE